MMEKDKPLKTILQMGGILHQLMYAVSKNLKEMEMTPEQPILLNIILNYGPLTQKDLADKMHIKPATLTARLQRLEKRNFIVRTNDKNDKRVQYVELTDLGKTNLETSVQVLKDVSKIAFNGFEDEDLLQLRLFVERMQTNLNELKIKNNEIGKE